MPGQETDTRGPGRPPPRGGDGDETPCPQSPPLSRLLHDLNQPLSAINTYTQAGCHLLDQGMADPARLKDLFTKIAAQAARATALSQDMRKVMNREEQQS